MQLRAEKQTHRTKTRSQQELINENDTLVMCEVPRGRSGAKEAQEGPTFGQFSRPRLGSHLVGL